MIFPRPHLYKLLGKLAVPCADVLEWGRCYETADRCVARTEVGPLLVSTVFLGIDHNYLLEGDALLFETMIFGECAESESFGSHCERTRTWAEAERAHAAAVSIAERRLASAI